MTALSACSRLWVRRLAQGQHSARRHRDSNQSGVARSHLGARSAFRCFSSSKGDDSENDTSVPKGSDKPVKPSIGTKFVPFRDEDSRVVLDYQEEKDNVLEEEDPGKYLYRERRRPESRASTSSITKRGVHGVFDIPDLVDALRLENLKDIAVIAVPPALRYCDYLVLASAVSVRHLNAAAQFLKKLHKLKRNKDDPFITIEGEDKSNDWLVLDMQSIVCHLLMPEAREKYDIETLWCVGQEFDEKTQKPEYDAVVNMMEKHMKFLDEMPLRESRVEPSTELGK